MARSWGVLLFVGVLTFLLGVALSVWPRETVALVSLLIAIHLVLSGGTQFVLGLVTSSRRGAPRLLAVIAGVVATLTGLLLLLRPLQTLTFVGWAAGLCVLVMGAADLLNAVLSRGSRQRGWQLGRGIIEVVVGGLLVANPHMSLGLLVLIACLWLISYGFLTIIGALLLRAERRIEPDAPAAGGPDSTRATS